VKQDADTAGKALGEAPSIHPTAWVRDSRFGRWCEVGERTRVAETSFGDYSYVVNDSDIIYASIGKFCSIAAHTRINPGNHPLERVALNHFTYRASAYGLGEDEAGFFDWRRDHHVTPGHDVWVGHGAIILPGISIGTGAAIGAGAIVTRDVPPYAIVVGNPGRVLRYRFPPDIIAALDSIAWWHWPHAKLRDCLADFRTLPAAAFCARHAPA
jgi:hypothetical protein